MNRPIIQSAPIERQEVFGGIVRNAAESGCAEIVDDCAAHRNLAADVHEDRQHAEDGVRMFQRAPAAGGMLRIGEVGEMSELERTASRANTIAKQR